MRLQSMGGAQSACKGGNAKGGINAVLSDAKIPGN